MGPPLFVLLISVGILENVLGLPANYVPADNDVYKVEHCVQMTPQKEAEVNSIVLKLSEYLYNLTLEYDDLDIRLVKIVVESHSENETEEKEVNVQLVVNDCAYTDDVIENKGEIHIGNDVIDTSVIEASEDRNALADNTSSGHRSTSNVEKGQVSETDGKSDVTAISSKLEKGPVDKEIAEDSVLIIENSDDTNVGEDSSVAIAGKAPEVMILNFDDEGTKLVDLYEKKHGNAPLLLYIRKFFGDLQYLFLN